MSNDQHPYQWQGPNGEWRVGVRARTNSGKTIEFEIKSVGLNSDDEWVLLMAHSNTRELEWVPESRLQPYPVSPIPQP